MTKIKPHLWQVEINPTPDDFSTPGNFQKPGKYEKSRQYDKSSLPRLQNFE